MKLTQEQLRKLAEWYGLELRTHSNKNFQILNAKEKNFGFKSGDTFTYPIYFMPDRDSNQLDMLEDKMIQELDEFLYCEIGMTENDASFGWWCIYYGKEGMLGKKVTIDAGGKTKNEARLNAIINYVEGLKWK